MPANDVYGFVTMGLPKAFTHSYGSQRAMRQDMTQGQGLLADFGITGRLEKQMLELECVGRGLCFRKASNEAPIMMGLHLLRHCIHNFEAITKDPS
jgi:hypothetical protein